MATFRPVIQYGQECRRYWSPQPATNLREDASLRHTWAAVAGHQCDLHARVWVDVLCEQLHPRARFEPRLEGREGAQDAAVSAANAHDKQLVAAELEDQ